MDKFYQLLTKRWFFWPLLAIPAIWRLLIPALTNGLGFNPLFELLHRTGQIAICLLVAVLMLSPLKTLFPRSRLVNALNRHRRAIGVTTFLYAAMHVTEHFIYEGGIHTYVESWRKPFFHTGTFAILVLFVMALTSNNFSVRRLHYPVWKWIHRIIFLAIIGLVWHVGTAGKGNWRYAKWVFIPLLLLQLSRISKLAYSKLAQRWRTPTKVEAVAEMRP